MQLKRQNLKAVIYMLAATAIVSTIDLFEPFNISYYITNPAQYNYSPLALTLFNSLDGRVKIIAIARARAAA